MSLDWNVESVEDWQLKRQDETLSSLLDTFIWSDLVIQMGGIPKDSIDEVYRRYKIINQCGLDIGYRMVDGKREPFQPTLEELERWAGLRTNVVRLSQKAFHADIMRRVASQVADSIRFEKRNTTETEA